MLAIDLIKYLERWAPPAVAWEKDNVGIQVGSAEQEIKGILLTLELNEAAIGQAIKKGCNFIFTHHPLIFNPIKNLDYTKDSGSRLIRDLVKNDIILYSAHTNLDFTSGGVSFELGRVLKLRNIDFLENISSNQIKLVVFVPEGDLEKVSDAVFNAGGGVIGEYERCSYRSEGEGTFRGSASANPAVGKKGNFEKVDEVRLEILVDTWKLRNVIDAMIKAHPYEEPAFDVYPLQNRNVNFGYGALGELDTGMKEGEFLSYVSEMLKSESLRYCNGSGKEIRRVAVCGGSGSNLLDAAIKKGADALVTADVKYHTFHDAQGKIMLIDAGHYETEIHSLSAVKRKIDEFAKAESNKIEIHLYRGSTNPIKVYNNYRSK